jgi:predicted transcriptional regulator
MTRAVVGVPFGERVDRALALAQERGIQHLLVNESGHVVGIACRCDLERTRGNAPVARCMSEPVVFIRSDQTVEDAAALMRERGVGCLPVVCGDLLVGIVTRSDLLRAGIPSEEVCLPCATCGSVHQGRAVGSVPFCRECLECPAPREELGGGD